MKKIFCYICIVLCLASVSAVAQTEKKETIKVWGNCGMCKTTIEKAAKKAGAATAEWNEDTHQLTVSYKDSKTSSEKIQKAVARSGYDTQDFTADQKAYDGLHGCCKYDRKGDASAAPAKKCCAKENCGTTPGCCKDEAGCKDKGCCKS